MLEELDNEKLLSKLKSIKISQHQFAKSKLLSNASYEKEKDAVSFVLKRNFVTDRGKDAVIYFFKIESYGCDIFGKIAGMNF